MCVPRQPRPGPCLSTPSSPLCAGLREVHPPLDEPRLVRLNVLQGQGRTQGHRGMYSTVLGGKAWWSSRATQAFPTTLSPGGSLRNQRCNTATMCPVTSARHCCLLVGSEYPLPESCSLTRRPSPHRTRPHAAGHAIGGPHSATRVRVPLAACRARHPQAPPSSRAQHHAPPSNLVVPTLSSSAPVRSVYRRNSSQPALREMLVGFTLQQGRTMAVGEYGTVRQHGKCTDALLD